VENHEKHQPGWWGPCRRLKRNYPFKRIYMLSKIKYRQYVSVIANKSSVSRYSLIAYICIKFLSRFENLLHVCNLERFGDFSHIANSS
jgi:hypothetical protein